MPRKHYNPKTKKMATCRAKSQESCPLKDEAGNPAPHFANEEDAKIGYERIMAEQNDPHDSLKKPTEQKPEITDPVELAKIQDQHLQEQRDEVRAKLEKAHDYVWDSRFGGKTYKLVMPEKEYWDLWDKDKELSAQQDELRRTIRGPITPYQQFTPSLLGLEDSQRKAMETENTSTYRPDDYMWTSHFDRDYPELLARYYGQYPGDEKLNEAEMKNLTQGDIMVARLRNPDYEETTHSQMYATMVFPEKDLQPVLDRIGVDNVSVSSFNNGREWGLAYTVMTPTGTRTFALHTHRNHDSFVIRGKENWNPIEQPYGPYADDKNGKDSKENVFAEFSGDTSKRVMAETMGYFLKSAQNGTLESDQDLIQKAERLDWTAILSEQMPFFKEWVEKNNPDKAVNTKDEFDFFDDDGNPLF